MVDPVTVGQVVPRLEQRVVATREGDADATDVVDYAAEHAAEHAERVLTRKLLLPCSL